MFSLAMSTVILRFTVFCSARDFDAQPHTPRELRVREIRHSTPRSYVLLIVDSRNITGRHPRGNAHGMVSRFRYTVGRRLLDRFPAYPAPPRGIRHALPTGFNRAHGAGPSSEMANRPSCALRRKSQLRSDAAVRSPATKP